MVGGTYTGISATGTSGGTAVTDKLAKLLLNVLKLLIDKATGLVYIGAFPESVFEIVPVALCIAGAGVVKSGTTGGTGGATDILKSFTVNSARFQNKVESLKPTTAPPLYAGGVDIPRIAPALAFVIADTSIALLGPE